MATLYVARRIGAAGFSKPVAIKVIHPHLSEDPKFVSMFVDEALLSARIDHPNVVRVDALRQHEDGYYLVMEYVRGCSLSQLLRVVRGNGSRLAPELAVAIGLRVAGGLHAAHELRDEHGVSAGVVHRDVNPANVLISYGGEVKLIDFGIAKAAGRSNATRTGLLKGKLAYMSPEQAFGKRVDLRTDVYALGLTIWECITMRRTFGGDDLAILEQVRNPKVLPPSAYAPDVPAELDRVVMRALSPRADERPADCQVLREMLMQAVPQAMLVDTSQIATVIRAVMEEQIDRERRLLPSGMFQTLPSVSDVERSGSDLLRVLPEEQPTPLPIQDTALPGMAPAMPATMVDPNVTPATFDTPQAPRKRRLRTPLAVVMGVLVVALVALGGYLAGRADPTVTTEVGRVPPVAQPATAAPGEPLAPAPAPPEEGLGGEVLTQVAAPDVPSTPPEGSAPVEGAGRRPARVVRRDPTPPSPPPAAMEEPAVMETPRRDPVRPPRRPTKQLIRDDIVF